MAEKSFSVHARLKIYKSPWIKSKFAKILESILACQNQVDWSILIWDIVDSGILQSDWPRAHMNKPNWKFLNQLLSSFNASQHAKNLADWPCCSWDTTDSRISQSDWPRKFVTIFDSLNQLSGFLNVYLHYKNNIDSSIFTRDIADWRILKSDWPKAFCTTPN